jgi:hypothetical protein
MTFYDYDIITLDDEPTLYRVMDTNYYDGTGKQYALRVVELSQPEGSDQSSKHDGWFQVSTDTAKLVRRPRSITEWHECRKMRQPA